MKKMLALMCTMLLLAVALTCGVHAEIISGKCGSKVTWSLNTENSTLTIAGQGEMQYYNSYVYVRPWDSYKDSISTVIIENGVTSITSCAFEKFSKLTSVEIPESIKSIGQNAFLNCDTLSFVDIPSLTAWCQIDFQSDSANPLFNNGVSLYIDGKKPTDLVIPDGITKINDYAFLGLRSLTSVTLPETVVSIGEKAFRFCENLTSVTIPSSVTSVGRDAFSICFKLTSVHISDLNAWCRINFKGDFIGHDRWLHSLYLNGALVEEIVLPNDISSVPAYAFENTSSIKKVVIPKEITIIEQSAFANCNNITEIYYTGTADEWERIRIADYNDPLLSATVYTDYVPDAMKIIFSANTTDAVSSLPNAASAIGSYTLPGTVPVCTGYKFLGWSTTPDGKAAYQPGDTVEISADTTFYAVWAEADKVALSGITLKNTAYEPISSIPTGDFIAEVTLTNNTYTGVCNILLATYDADGRMLHVRYVYANPVLGQTLTFGTEFSGADGRIAKIKAFALSDLRTFSVLCPTAEWSSDGQ